MKRAVMILLALALALLGGRMTQDTFEAVVNPQPLEQTP